ncbi:TorF family putative porin [Qipengyuania sp. S6317L1]|uniref:TorF family putative porin n=1 Tax=Qipengyuania sp. S6317L1 TaxID=2926410 RepID=UPI001FF5AC9E|nr:TorF family putative porin [Qipengyuania sp. S6317L1]MCK0099804.1 TorF family putative porin [Qipengyuania sp. S6317L1]
MLTSIRGLSAATLSAGLLFAAAPAFAEEAKTESTAEEAVVLDTASLRAAQPVDEARSSNMAEDSEISFSANVALTSEYRFRGVDLSGGEIAIQGGFDLGHSSGLYVGTWASSLDEQTVGYGSTELDLYAGWSGDLTDGLSADVGAIVYIYPDAGPGDFDYYEFYGSLSASIGPASVTGGFAYAPDQDSLGSTDNLYFYTDVGVAIPDTPITINGHVGYTDGFLTFTNNSKAWDYSIGADFAVGPATLTAAYVGVEGDAAIDPLGTFTDDAFVLTLSASF